MTPPSSLAASATWLSTGARSWGCWPPALRSFLASRPCSARAALEPPPARRPARHRSATSSRRHPHHLRRARLPESTARPPGTRRSRRASSGPCRRRPAPASRRSRIRPWGTIPPTKGNQYYAAVNEPALGSGPHAFQIADGNIYGDKPRRGPRVAQGRPGLRPQAVVNLPPRFGSRSSATSSRPSRCTSRRPRRGVPNLANIPTDAVRLRLQRSAVRPAVPRRDDQRRDRSTARPARRAGHHGRADHRAGPDRPGQGDFHGRQTKGCRGPSGRPPRIHGSCLGGARGRQGSSTASRPTSTAPRSSGTPHFAQAAPGHPDAVAGQTATPFAGLERPVALPRPTAWAAGTRRCATTSAATRRTGSELIDPLDASGGEPVLFKSNPANIFLRQEVRGRGEDQGGPRARERPRRAVRDGGVRHHQHRRRGRPLHARCRPCACPDRPCAVEPAADVHLPRRPAHGGGPGVQYPG